MAKMVFSVSDYNESCCKFYVFLLNFLIAIVGLFIGGFGLWMNYDLNAFGVLSLDSVIDLPWLAIAYGGSVVLSCFVAYFFLKKSLFLFMYASCLFIIFIFGLSLGIISIILSHRVKDTVMKSITVQMENYLSNPKDVMDGLQSELECCGNTEPSDWLRTSAGQIPPSCCKIKLCDTTKPEEIYSDGCYEALLNHVQYQISFLAFAALIFSSIPFTGCIVTFIVAHATVHAKYQQVQ